MACKRTFVVLAAVIVGAFATRTMFAQEPPKPGPEHEILKMGVGSWETTMKMEDGTEFKGSAKMTLTCGGLWLVSDFKTDLGGMDFQGHGIDGYDLDKKKYVSVWVDSMESAPQLFEGDYDKESKTLTMTGNGKGPDGKPAKYKTVSSAKDADHHTFKMFLVGADGKDSLFMTIEYQRKK